MTSNEMALMANIAVDMQKNEVNEVLDNIRAEIQENINYNKKMNYQGIVAGLLLTLNIIDKYKESKNNNEYFMPIQSLTCDDINDIIDES